MLDDRMNDAAPFSLREVQSEVERRPHQCYAQYTDQCRGAGKAGGHQGEAAALLPEKIVPRRRNVLETELRREMRAVSHGFDCALDDNTGCRAFDCDDRNPFLGWSVGYGPAHHTQDIRTLTIPPGRRGDPFLPAVDNPAGDARQRYARLRQAAEKRRWQSPRFAGAESGQLRSTIP